MAEFCRECFLKLEEDNRLEDQIILSDSLEFCEAVESGKESLKYCAAERSSTKSGMPSLSGD